MGNLSSNVTRVNQNITNNFLDVNDATCATTVTTGNKDNTLNMSNVTNSNVNVFNVSGSINATCRISQQVSQSAAEVLQSQTEMEASNSSDWFNGGTIYSSQTNRANIQQNILNNMLNVSVSTCNSTVNTANQDNVASIQYVSKTKINAYNVENDVNSNCTISNVSTQSSSAKVASRASQLAKNVGMMVAIFTALFMCISICVIGGIFIFGGFIFVKSKSSSKKAEAAQEAPYATPQKQLSLDEQTLAMFSAL